MNFIIFDNIQLNFIVQEVKNKFYYFTKVF